MCTVSLRSLITENKPQSGTQAQMHARMHARCCGHLQESELLVLVQGRGHCVSITIACTSSGMHWLRILMARQFKHPLRSLSVLLK